MSDLSLSDYVYLWLILQNLTSFRKSSFSFYRFYSLEFSFLILIPLPLRDLQRQKVSCSQVTTNYFRNCFKHVFNNTFNKISVFWRFANFFSDFKILHSAMIKFLKHYATSAYVLNCCDVELFVSGSKKCSLNKQWYHK